MKAVLFCNLPYAFGILKPIADELEQRNIETLWYVPEEIIEIFPFENTAVSSHIKIIRQYKADMIFVSGNTVPYFLRGVKIQIFHGLAGEKKGHFRIRDFFDLYLTQGPYFTNKFKALAKKHQDFDVIETGWAKLDALYKSEPQLELHKQQLLAQSGKKKLILYAPTFSPSLTSAKEFFEPLQTIANESDYLVIIKFHDKHIKEDIEHYREKVSENFIISDEKNINNLLKMSDLMVSDTSSVVYEFLLLDKPVITYKNQSENLNWHDIESGDLLIESIHSAFSNNDPYREARQYVIQQYHPYTDGKSAKRMVDASIQIIEQHGVPEKRLIKMSRKLQILKNFGIPGLNS